METVFRIDADGKTPKYLQVVNSINEAIRRGKLRKGDQVFSINELSDELFFGRDTVQKAYNIYKKQIYNSFVKTMGNKASVDIQIHHSNARVFESLLLDHLQEYDYFVIMPHFYDHPHQIRSVIQQVPAEKLVVLDKDLPFLHPSYTAVFQDFKNDIYEALEEGMGLLRKYEKLVLVQPGVIPYPPEIAVGFRNFCTNNQFPWSVIPEIDAGTVVRPGEVYIVIEETDLVNLIKICRLEKLQTGKDVGIISYNETPLKEILLDGITVVSTDHCRMGETVARLILDNKREKVKNPFKLIKRGSL